MATTIKSYPSLRPIRLQRRSPAPAASTATEPARREPAATAERLEQTDAPDHSMRCMEIWGGNTSTNTALTMAGLDAWVYSEPHGQGNEGGDVYYASSCAAGHVARVLLADVSGHGSSVSDTADQLCRFMRRYMNYRDQRQLIARLNRAFEGVSSTGGFATAVAATYSAPDMELTISNAGHPRPLWYRADERRWTWVDVDSTTRDNAAAVRSSFESDPADLPLGILRPTRYRESTITLGQRDLLVFYTDSLIDAPDGSGRRLGERGLLGLISSMNSVKPRHIIADTLATLRERSGGSLGDDASLIIVRPNANWPRMTLRFALRVAARILRLVVGGVRKAGRPIAWPQLRG